MGFDYYWHLFYLYALRFALQLVFCEGLFCTKLAKRKNFAARLIALIIIYIAVCFGIFFLFILNNQNLAGPRFPYYMQIPYYLLNWALSLLLVRVCFKVRWSETLFIANGGYALQHLGFSIVAFIRYFISYKFNIFVENILFEIIPFLTVGAIAYFALILPGGKKSELRDKDVRFLALAAVVLTSTVVLSVFSRMFRGADTDILSRLICRPYSVICCTLILMLMYGLTKGNKLEHDNELMEFLLNMEKNQHQIIKENVDIINIKCHDLKTRLRRFVKLIMNKSGMRPLPKRKKR